MSDDINKEKDEIIETNSESTDEVKEEVEAKAEETAKEDVIEAKVEEEEIPVTPEPTPEPEPIEETLIEDQPAPEPEPETTINNVEEPKVEIPDQVVNNDNNNNSNYQQNDSNTVNQTQTTKPQGEKKGMAIVALILSILGFFTGWLVIGGLFGFIAIILGIVVLAKKKAGKGMAITSIILSLMSMFAACITAFILIPIFGIMGFGISTYNKYSDQIPEIYSNIVEEVQQNYDLNEIGNIFDLNSIGFNTTSSSNTTQNSVTTNTISNTTNTTNTVSNTVSNSTVANTVANGIKLGNYTVKYGKYEGEASVDGVVLTLKEDGTGTYDGKSCTWVKGSHDFAQDSSTRGSIKDCIVVKTSEGTYYLYATNNATLTDGDISLFKYVG